MPPKKLSGYENRKRRLQQEEADRKHPKLSSFFSPKSNSGDNAGSTSSGTSISPDLSSNDCEVKPTEDTVLSEGKNNCMHELKHQDHNCNAVDDLGNNVTAGNTENVESKFENSPKRNINYNDPAHWPDELSMAESDHIIMNGPHPINKQYNFPKDANKRSFSVTMMYRKINNVHHLECLKKWFETLLRLQTNKSIDKGMQSRVGKEREHWCKVLERLMSITLYLAEHNLAFRGTSDTLFTPHNGNFLGLVELLGKYDLTMSKHLRRVVSKETHIHYCEKNVQNEIINLLGNAVQENILNRAKEAKYFSLILDCTPDISHVEQLSFTIRFLDVEDISIKEHFVNYKPVIDTTGKGLYESILDFLRASELDLHNCRGQGYDNGSNMKGKNKGVQARIMKENPQAFYMPCGCHSLNLVVGDRATSCRESTSFFGTVQRIYILCSASPCRWHALKKHVKCLTAKPLCETRWECRLECVKAIKYEIIGIREALYELSEMPASDPAMRHEAETLVTQIEDYSFLVMLNVWYDVLGR
ncbi:zinc finger MYM-type protein 1-like, partial [Scyliorhinus canicula]|uniref:zinc finger MYM-type protein 1-like n=1 Tax=Scyliorhinus canicula TaxID=7830 RepID=UPI0018F55F7E